MFAIYNQDLTIVVSNSYDSAEKYERLKEKHLNPNNIRYGDKLVRLRRVTSGISIKIKIIFRSKFTFWKPEIEYRFGELKIVWLRFYLNIHRTFTDRVAEVIRDHLEESKK